MQIIGVAAFIINPATRAASSENTWFYDGSASGVNFYAYVNNNPVNGNDPSGNFANLVVGGLTNVALGYGVSLITGHEYTLANAASDAALGAIGAGIVSKLNTLAKLNEINQLTNAGKELVTSGLVPKFTSTISQPITRSEAFNLGGLFTGNNSISTILKNGSQQLTSADNLLQFRSPAFKVNTGIFQSNFESNIFNSIGNTKTITNIHADVTRFGTQIEEGLLGGTFAAQGGFVLYPNKSNTNQMRSVYAK